MKQEETYVGIDVAKERVISPHVQGAMSGVWTMTSKR